MVPTAAVGNRHPNPREALLPLPATSRAIRILHLEDNAVDAERVRSELERAGLKIIVARVESSESFQAALSEFVPDVVLSDHQGLPFDARAALALVQAVRPAAPLILVSSWLDERVAVDCLRAGAEDIVLKRNLDRLSGAIEAALLVRRRLNKLTPRQLEVLRLVATGHTTREIARRLRRSAKTVETHRGEVMKRLGLHDVVRLVRYAARVGLAPLEF